MASAYLLKILLFSLFTLYASGQEVGDALSKISYKTGLLEGGNGEDLTLTVNWNGTEFSCISNPDTVNTTYECSSLSQASATRIPSIEYFINVDWPRANTPLQITQFVLTDDTGTEYTIQEFCHPQQMQCTLDTAESITPGSMASCTQWGSKDSYDNIQLGSNTKFSALYVDIPIFGSRFANKVIEGGVRPPNLANIGLVTGGATAGLLAPISVQWDNALYTCTDITPIASDTPYSCSSLSEPLYCPAISDFWMSIYSNKNTPDFLLIKEIWFEDETSATYTFTETFCRDPSGPQQPGSTCTEPATFVDLTEIYIGGNFAGTQFQKLVPFFVPDCIYNYPDSVNTLDVNVGAGSIITTAPEDSEFSWDSSLGGFGGPIDAKCPETGKPTSDPTLDPTVDPTSDPTFEPTVEPTADPTIDPTMDPTMEPTHDPTIDPTIDPTNDPTKYPTVDPTVDPTIEPTLDPSSSPIIFVSQTSVDTDLPTKYPTASPTKEPKDGQLITSKTVFWVAFIAIATFLVCFLCCLAFICWRRRKKKEEKKKKEPLDNAVQRIPTKTPGDDSSDSDAIAKQNTYQEFNAGAIDTHLSEEFGQDEAKEVELQTTTIEKQVTLDGVTATGADVEAGNMAVLDALTQNAKKDGTTDGGITGDKGSNDAIQTVDSDNFEFNV